jgi:hypothetical protein
MTPPMVIVFFVFLVIYVGFFLLNLVLAAIWTSFNKVINLEEREWQSKLFKETTMDLQANIKGSGKFGAKRNSIIPMTT